jgi:tetratricopeptide (TPR) repeat protein
VEVYVAHSSRLRLLSARSSEDLAIAIDCIAKAMEISPESTEVTDELVALAGLRDVSDALLDQQLQTALNSGVSPGLVHFILGTRAMSATPPNIESAMQHFALTATHSPGMPGLLNNLADAICEQPDGNLEQALSFVNQAIAFLPDQPRVFDTRGKIYLRQKEWLKAVADFEKALADEDLRLAAHERLAEAYEGLGNVSQAAFHRGMAKVLREQQKPDVASGAVPTPPPGE